MKLSVLINNYNNAPFLEECLESVLQQERPADEIIVVDDGSTDASREILERYNNTPSVKIIYQENQGQTKAVATAIEHAQGDILFLLDGDDIYYPNHLAALERRWMEYPTVDLTYCRCDYANEPPVNRIINNSIGPVHSPEEAYEWGYTAVLANIMPYYFFGNVNSTISLKRKHALVLPLDDIMRASPIFPYTYSDYAILLASALSFGRKLYVPDTTVGYRIRKESDSHQQSQLLEYERYMFGMGAVKISCLKILGINFDFLDIDIFEEEKAFIPNPSQEHLNCYKVARERIPRLRFDLQQRIDFLERQLNDFQQSGFWKITKPLRAIRSLLKKMIQK